MAIDKYDKTNPLSIEANAKLLTGRTFLDVINNSDLDDETRIQVIEKFGNPKRKGGLGNLLEEIYFGYKPNSEQDVDFKSAGVELKVSPYEKLINGQLRVGERLVITMISYSEPIEPNFDLSHVWNKIKLLLLIYYYRNKDAISNLHYSIDFAKLFSPPEEDLLIIKRDYETIVQKIRSGLAHEISESDTMYLGACTKGASLEKGSVFQYYNSSKIAMKRAFCLKTSYMNYVLNKYVVNNQDTKIQTENYEYETIIPNSAILKNSSFEAYIVDRINSYAGMSDAQLCELFGRPYNNNKSQWVDLAYKMLGIKSNKAEEFEKANITVKSIRIESNGSIAESMSFPPFKFKDLVKEEWENSELCRYFEEKKFLFVIYFRSKDVYILKNCQLWNMPTFDLIFKVRRGWLNIQNKIKNGVTFTKKITKNGFIIENDLPKKSYDDIIHIRPHTAKRAYALSSGEIIGDIKKHANELPDGQWMTTQSFWINNFYILDQIVFRKKE